MSPLRAEDGGFDTGNCTPEETESIKEALRVGQIAAREALRDVTKGRHSKYGFWALFKSQFNVLKVQQMLRNLSTIPPMPHIYRNAPDETTSPVFLCVTDSPEPLIQVSWRRCQDDRTDIAHYARATAYIELCPRYFQKPVAPDPQKNGDFCPTVRKNQYSGSCHKLLQSQSQVILHELVQFYLGKDDTILDEEEYDLNNIVGQSPQAARLTPRAYEYYIACESCACFIRRW